MLLDKLARHYGVEPSDIDEVTAALLSEKLGYPAKPGDSIVSLVEHAIFAVSEKNNAFIPMGTIEEQIDKLEKFLMIDGQEDLSSSVIIKPTPVEITNSILANEVIEPEFVEDTTDYKSLCFAQGKEIERLKEENQSLVSSLDKGKVPGQECPTCHRHIPLPWPRE